MGWYGDQCTRKQKVEHLLEHLWALLVLQLVLHQHRVLLHPNLCRARPWQPNLAQFECLFQVPPE